MSKRLAALQQRQTEVSAVMDNILDTAANEDRDLTADETKHFDECKTEITSIGARIEREKAAAAAKPSWLPDLPAPRNANGPGNGNPQPVVVVPGKGQFDNVGTFLQAVMRADHPDIKFRDEKLTWVSAVNASGMNEGNPTEGGYLLQPEFAVDLARNAYETGVLTGLVRRRRIGANSNSVKTIRVEDYSRATGSRVGGMRWYWTAEAGQKQASKIRLTPWEASLYKLAGIAYATDELLEDATALEGVLKDSMDDELGFVLDGAIFEGTGAGMPLGLMLSKSKITVPKEGTQGAGTIVTENILKMYEAFATRSKNSPKARWLHSAGVPRALFNMTQGGTATVFGTPVFLPPGNSLTNRPNATLMGIPMQECEHCEPLGTEGDLVLFDGNQYVMLDKQDRPKFDISIHVRFIYDETCFRWVYRVGGRPLWDEPVAPYKGTISQSPIVTLQSR